MWFTLILRICYIVWVAWVKWERGFMTGMGRMGHVSPQNFGAGQRRWQGRNFGVG